MKIVSIGEVVWDIFPDRQVLGGAPVNVAYHLMCLGIPANIITRIGRDERGDKTLRQLRELGLPTDGVQVDPALATGTVQITFNERNEHHFDIISPAAWDNLQLATAEEIIGSEPFGLVFGTLAQRNEASREVIRSLWEKAAVTFYDVNLRPPFTTQELVRESLDAADVIKVNGDELVIIAGWYGIDAVDGRSAAADLLAQLGAGVIVVTEGAEGAWLLAGGRYYSSYAPHVEVVDTVGAGDAFFAAFIHGYLKKDSWQELLVRANKRGSYVASCAGATPPMPQDIR